jgi:hypothetical protein
MQPAGLAIMRYLYAHFEPTSTSTLDREIWQGIAHQGALRLILANLVRVGYITHAEQGTGYLLTGKGVNALSELDEANEKEEKE